MAINNSIVIKGAREHNLKNIDVTIPRDKLVVITGLSGSGKSSLAFDTMYAEGQRRYVESLSAYARQFLGQMDKPDVDSIDGLSPAISIDQKTTSKNPRSTVGTVTEIYDYLRLLFARVGVPHCPKCGKVIEHQTIDSIVDKILALPERTKMNILAPVIRGKKGEYVKLFESAKKSGFVRVRVDGTMYELSEEIKLEKNKKHSIEIVIDRLIVKEDIKKRLTDSLETALKHGNGMVIIENLTENREMIFNQNCSCPDCEISIDELQPRSFSFNNPFGACPACTGLGHQLKVDINLLVEDWDKSINEGAISASGWKFSEDNMAGMHLKGLADHYGFSLDTPMSQLSEMHINKIFYGTGMEKVRFSYERKYGSGSFIARFEGVANNIRRRHAETQSDMIKAELEKYMTDTVCEECNGARLKKESLAVTVADMNIDALTHLSVDEELEFFKNLKLSERDMVIGKQILKEITERLTFLKNVGLDYLTLARSSGTLSGGEAQRIRLATQIGSSLMGVLYILDEPSIGLHQRDNDKLIETLKKLRDLGNTLIVVEHDEDTMYAADHIIDIGPGAGIHGGNVVAQGTIDDIKKCEDSQTGLYLSGKKQISVPAVRREGNGNVLKVYGAAQNNLKNVDVEFPLGRFIAVTGVSGSGKSSLINEVVFKHLSNKLNHSKKKPGKFDRFEGIEHLDSIID
ncbi:MAG: excinuclease ABC subunit UvrA, partial [Clostridia bacterium]|nr:excinuclease ABC subunit UvrA [Clostridia bacterium]